MSRPVAALSSELLVRKGSARPLGLEPTERTPYDVAIAIRPTGAQAESNVHQLPPTVSDLPVARSRDAAARMGEAWKAVASRWGLPTILFIAGLGMVTVVAATGSGPAPTTEAAAFAVPASRPQGPTPVNWVDNGLMAHPGLAGR